KSMQRLCRKTRSCVRVNETRPALGRRAESSTGPLLLIWVVFHPKRPQMNRPSHPPGFFSRPSGRAIGRLQAQAFRDLLPPFGLAEGTAALHAWAKRFQFLLVFGLIHSLKPIHWHFERPRRQQ